jgi:diguanylate cyclase (GGDEF)-like protein
MPDVDVFTLYLAVAAICLALSLVWLVVARTFPTIYAARFWFAGTLAASVGSALSLWQGGPRPMLPVLAGHGFILLGSGLGWAGVRQFRGKSVPWPAILGITAAALAALTLATFWHDDMGLRIVIFSAAQSVIIGWVVIDILDRRVGSLTPGGLMAAGACGVLLLLNAARTVLAVFAVHGEMVLTTSNLRQSALLFLVAVFGALVCQLGFLLMTMDRLHAEMTQLAGVDDLTGAANRRRFLAACEQECIRSSRSGRVFSLMVIDVDRFKAINDDHGHAAGDEFLRRFASAARAQLRGQDMFARLGGDEFCVLMPETSGVQAARIADRLAAAIRRNTFSRNGATVGSTISIGVAEWSAPIGRDAFALLERADRALYLTKNRGRDGVTVAPESGMPGPTPEPVAA